MSSDLGSALSTSTTRYSHSTPLTRSDTTRRELACTLALCIFHPTEKRSRSINASEYRMTIVASTPQS